MPRFTNERHSCTKETIDMPRLPHSIPTLIGSHLKICIVSLNKKRLDFESAIVLAIALLGKLFFDFQNVSTVENGFFHQRY